MARQESPPHVSLDIAGRTLGQRILHSVPSHLRENKKHMYDDPVVVFLGPYHHGQPQFCPVETFKDEVLNIILDSECGAKDRGLLFHSNLLEQVDEIRSFYGGLSKDEYEDEALAEMMLRDACLVLYIMESQTENGNQKRFDIVRRLGMFRIGFIMTDLFVLYNQIPLWVIKLLTTLTCGGDDDDDEQLLCNFFCLLRSGDHRLARVPWVSGGQEPLHILDALRCRILQGRNESDF